jgi:hypothetical protein
MAQQPNPILMWWWQHRINRMKRCSTLGELRRRCGDPDNIVATESMELWHYQLRTAGGFLYSIHVAVIEDRPDQVYLHMEPVG